MILFNQVKDKRGILSALELKNIPFRVKRIFLLHNLNTKEKRGGHYHKKCKQYLIVISGKCNIILEYKKTDKIEEYKKVSKGAQFYIPKYCKITIDKPSKDCYICVLCNKKYNSKDAYYD